MPLRGSPSCRALRTQSSTGGSAGGPPSTYAGVAGLAEAAGGDDRVEAGPAALHERRPRRC